MRDFNFASKMLTRLLITLVATTGMSLAINVATPTEASAQSRSFTEGPPVRRKLLIRSSRFELTPSISGMFGGAYEIPFYIGLTGEYHLTNDVSLGIDVHGSPVALDRKVVRDLEQENPALNAHVSIASTPLLTNFHVTYAPITGKLNAFKNKIAHFDVHFVLGVGGAYQMSDNPALQGFEFGAVVGVGTRIFVSDSVALLARVTDYIYPNAEAARDLRSPRERWRNHFVGTFGVSLFFPDKVYVSR